MSGLYIAMADALSIVFLVAGVSMMLVIHILVVFWALRQGVAARSSGGVESIEHGGGRGGGGLSAHEVGRLPCYDFKAGGGDCAVCLEVFQAGDRCRRLPRCNHSFHAPCVDLWLRKSRLCPVCRADVVSQPVDQLKTSGAAAEASGTPERRTPAALEIVAER